MPNVKLILGDKKNKKKDDFLVSKTKSAEKSNKKTTSKKDDFDKKIAFYFISGVGVATALSAFIVFGALMGLKNDTKLEVPKTGVVEGTDEAEGSQEETKDIENTTKEEDTEVKKDVAEKEDNPEAASESSENGVVNSNTNNAAKNVGNNAAKKNASSSIAKKVSNKNSGSKTVVKVAKPSINNPQANSSNNTKATDSNKTFEKTAKEKCDEQVGPREYLGYEVLTTEEKGTKTSKTTYYRYIPANGSRFKMVYRNNNCVADLSNKRKAGEISIEEYIEALDKFVW